jgi:outer membrane protein assembly factor BamB
MTSNGSYVAAGSLVSARNGSVYYFNGTSGALLWKHQAYAAVQPVVMSPEGAYVAAVGNGALLFNSRGDLLWNYTNLGLPVAFLQGDSLVILSGGHASGVNLVGYNGTILATFDIHGEVAVSQSGSEWVDAAGSIGTGGCATLHVFDGSTALPSIQLCSSR